MPNETKDAGPPDTPGSRQKKGRVIHTEVRTTASPEQVWQAWTDPARIAEWFTDAASGEPVVGSTYIWEFHKFNYKIPYTVLEAVPNERFSIGWSIPGRDPGILEITIRRGEGETVVTLVNSGFREGAEWDDEYEGVVSGWQMALHILKEYLERYFGRTKTTILCMRPAPLEYERLRPYFLDERLLSRWLTMAGGVPRAGERYVLQLRDGSRASGRVLIVTRREVALTWEEIGGVLELKAFSMGPAGRAVAVRVLSWDLPADRAPAIEQRMDEALGRLVGEVA
ncbi:MAG TPA: SRPBCC domain-containing protein [Gemmatimonadaceae bacterium]|nr:SRPBCC domain-containing protein [Gemmatimonadaceae bacterium]